MPIDPTYIAQWTADAELVHRVAATRRDEPGLQEAIDRLAVAGIVLLTERRELLESLRLARERLVP